MEISLLPTGNFNLRSTDNEISSSAASLHSTPPSSVPTPDFPRPPRQSSNRRRDVLDARYVLIKRFLPRASSLCPSSSPWSSSHYDVSITVFRLRGGSSRRVSSKRDSFIRRESSEWRRFVVNAGFIFSCILIQQTLGGVYFMRTQFAGFWTLYRHGLLEMSLYIFDAMEICNPLVLWRLLWLRVKHLVPPG